ncbi:TPA: hypothetical protein ACKPZ5_004837 [Serratia marcescens]
MIKPLPVAAHGLLLLSLAESEAAVNLARDKTGLRSNSWARNSCLLSSKTGYSSVCTRLLVSN